MTSRRIPFNPADYPALRDFLAGYLHQDFPVDHKTPRGAIRAFDRDANVAERSALAREAARLLPVLAEASWTDAKNMLARLGAAWLPRSRADLDRFLRTLSKRPPA